MSVSIRISDDTYDGIMELKAKDVSINKTADMILQLALKGIEKYKISMEDSQNDSNEDEDFSERIKKMTECIFEELKECDAALRNQKKENILEDFEKSENENFKMHIQELENEILNLKKSEEHFSKIENELSEISKMIFENQKEVIEKIKTKQEDFSEEKINYATLISAKKEQIFLMTCKKTQYPYILPDDKKPWCYMMWHISDEHNTATLEYNFNPLAVADVAHQKIMIITQLEQQVWYEQEGDMRTLMYICERKLMRAFPGKLPLWFQKGMQFTYDEAYKQNLYNKQAEINEERRKRGLYEFDSFRY